MARVKLWDTSVEKMMSKKWYSCTLLFVLLGLVTGLTRAASPRQNSLARESLLGGSAKPARQEEAAGSEALQSSETKDEMSMKGSMTSLEDKAGEWQTVVRRKGKRNKRRGKDKSLDQDGGQFTHGNKRVIDAHNASFKNYYSPLAMLSSSSLSSSPSTPLVSLRQSQKPKSSVDNANEDDDLLAHSTKSNVAGIKDLKEGMNVSPTSKRLSLKRPWPALGNDSEEGASRAKIRKPGVHEIASTSPVDAASRVLGLRDSPTFQRLSLKLPQLALGNDSEEGASRVNLRKPGVHEIASTRPVDAASRVLGFHVKKVNANRYQLNSFHGVKGSKPEGVKPYFPTRQGLRALGSSYRPVSASTPHRHSVYHTLLTDSLGGEKMAPIVEASEDSKQLNADDKIPVITKDFTDFSDNDHKQEDSPSTSKSFWSSLWEFFSQNHEERKS